MSDFFEYLKVLVQANSFRRRCAGGTAVEYGRDVELLVITMAQLLEGTGFTPANTRGEYLAWAEAHYLAIRSQNIGSKISDLHRIMAMAADKCLRGNSWERFAPSWLNEDYIEDIADDPTDEIDSISIGNGLPVAYSIWDGNGPGSSGKVSVSIVNTYIFLEQ